MSQGAVYSSGVVASIGKSTQRSRRWNNPEVVSAGMKLKSPVRDEQRRNIIALSRRKRAFHHAGSFRRSSPYHTFKGP